MAKNAERELERREKCDFAVEATYLAKSVQRHNKSQKNEECSIIFILNAFVFLHKFITLDIRTKNGKQNPGNLLRCFLLYAYIYPNAIIKLRLHTNDFIIPPSI